MADYKYNFDFLELPDEEDLSQVEDDEPVLSGGKLKKDDLLEYQNLNKVRTYMIQRKGVDYKDKDANDVVEDFVDHILEEEKYIFSYIQKLYHLLQLVLKKK